MVKAVAEEGKPYFFDEGVFLAQLVSVEERRVTYRLRAHHAAVKNGKGNVGDEAFFDQWRWTWELLQGAQAGSRIDVDTDPKIVLEGDSLARDQYEALIGRALELGEQIDTDVVLGAKARLRIVHRDPVARHDGTTGYYTDVTEVLPAQGDEVETPSPWADDAAPF